MDKYDELRLESIKRAEQRHELVEKIEKREKIVDIGFNIALWSWIIIWMIFWNFETKIRHINFFLSILIYTIVCGAVSFIIARVSLWIHSNVGKTVK